MDRVVRLSGEHATLPMAELEALLAVHDPAAEILHPAPCLALVAPGDAAAADRALKRMAMAHAWAECWALTKQGEAGIPLLADAAASHRAAGTIAVRASRTGRDPRISRRRLELEIGKAMAAAGHPIDLADPQVTAVAWADGPVIALGRLSGIMARGRFESRTVNDRAHFSPVALHPRLGAALVHLARAPPGGRIYDPFCGTGGLLLEAALDGYDVLGSDLDAWMVQGSLQTLADAGPQALAGDVFQADVEEAAAMAGPVDAIVTDMPYGQASTTNLEPLGQLYGRAFAAWSELLPAGARAVFGCADDGLGRGITDHGFVVEAVHVARVHRSLTRRFFVARRSQD